MTPHYEGLLGNKQLGVGAVDVQAPNVETGEQVAERIRAHPWLAPEQTIITSSCGFNHLPRHIALGKLRAMTEAKAILLAKCKVHGCMQDNEREAEDSKRALRASEERLRVAEGASGIGTFEIDLDSERLGLEPAGSRRSSDSIRQRPNSRSQAGKSAIFVDDVPKIHAAFEQRAADGHLLRRIPGQASRRTACTGLPARAK